MVAPDLQMLMTGLAKSLDTVVHFTPASSYSKNLAHELLLLLKSVVKSGDVAIPNLGELEAAVAGHIITPLSPLQENHASEFVFGMASHLRVVGKKLLRVVDEDHVSRYKAVALLKNMVKLQDATKSISSSTLERVLELPLPYPGGQRRTILRRADRVFRKRQSFQEKYQR